MDKTFDTSLIPLVEVIERPQIDLEEREVGGKKQLWLETIVQQADIRNRNGRVYPRAVLEREVEQFQKHIAEGTSYGEADHPKPGQTPSATRQAILWKKVWMEQNGAVMGRGIVMDTTVGKDVKAILEAGGAIGTSSRGRGSVALKAAGTVPVPDVDAKEQVEVVNDDYKMRTFDLVIDQSVETALSRRTKYEQHLIEQELDQAQEDQVMTMTLDELKEKHPEVYQSLLDEAKGAQEGEIQTKLENLLKEKEAEIRQSVMDELEEEGGILDEEAVAHCRGMEAFAALVVEGAKEAGLLEDHVLAEDEAADKIKELKAENDELAKKCAALEAANAKLREAVEADEVEEAAKEFAKDHALSEALTESLLGECPDIDTFNEKKEAIKQRFDSIAENLTKTQPQGKGKTHLNEDDNPKPGEKKDEEIQEQTGEHQRAKTFLKTLAG